MSVAKTLYLYIGSGPLKACLSDIRSAQMKELEDYFNSEESGKLKPTRFLRSALAQAQMNPNSGNDNEEEEEEMDSFNLMEPVNVMDKLTDDFFTLIESKNWKERQAQVDLLASIVNVPRIVPTNDLTNLYRALKQIIAKDVNMMVLAKAIECIGYLANGLRKDFAHAAKILTSVLLNRFKEKKPFVKAAVHSTFDTMYQNCILISDIIGDICETFTTHKLANVRSETLIFLIRCLNEPPKRLRGNPPVGKEDVKLIARGCIEAMNDSAGEVRDLAAQTLGTLTGIVGERVIQPYLAKLDGVRLKKVQSCIPEKTTPVVIPDKVVITSNDIKNIKKSSPKKPTQTTNKKPTNTKKPKSVPSRDKPSSNRNTSKPTTTSSRPTTNASQEKKSKPTVSKSGIPPKVQNSNDYKHLLSEEEALPKAEELLTETVIEQINDRQWQSRQSGVEIIEKMMKQLSVDEQLGEYSDILVRQLITKPGFKETNFNVMNAVFNTLILLSQLNSKLSKGAVAEIIEGTTIKLADMKCKGLAADCLSSIVDNCTTISPCFAIDHVMKHSINHRNPKVIQESLAWIIKTITEYGCKDLDIRSIIMYCKSGYMNTNPHVRNNVTELLVLVKRFIGPSIKDLLQDVKSAILVTLEKEFEKSNSLPTPIPTKSNDTKLLNTNNNEMIKSSNNNENIKSNTVTTKTVSNTPTQNVVPESFSKSISTELLDQLHDKDWRERKNGLIFLQTLLNRHKSVPYSSSLFHALIERLSENNGALLILTLNIFEQLIPAVGSNIDRNLKFVPGILRCLGDSKKQISSSALNCLQILCKEVPFSKISDDVAAALDTTSKTVLLNFLAEDIFTIDSVENKDLEGLIVPTLICLQDRSSDVRKAGNTVISLLINRFGYEEILNYTKKLRPGMQTTVIASLEKIGPTRVKSAQTTRTPIKSPYKKPQQSPYKPPNTIIVDLNQKSNREQNSKDWFISDATSVHDSSLKTLMKGNISSELISKLFGTGTQIIQGIHELLKSLSTLQKETISCLDLILKWITLQISIGSSNIVIEVLKYNYELFLMLDKLNYTLSEYEANIYFPVIVYHQGPIYRELNSSELYESNYTILFTYSTKIYPSGKICKFLASGSGKGDVETTALSFSQLSQLILKTGVKPFFENINNPNEFLYTIVEEFKDSEDENRMASDAAKELLINIYQNTQSNFWNLLEEIPSTDKKLIENIIIKKSTTTTISSPKISSTKKPEIISKDIENNDDNDNDDFISLDTLNEWCSILNSKKSSRCIQVLKLICSNIEQDSIQIGEADKLVIHLQELTEYIFNESKINIRLCKYILRTWQVIFSKKLFINAISMKPLKIIIKQILVELQNPKLQGIGNDGKQITQALYNAVLLILNNYDRSDTIVLFLELLTIELNEESPSPSYVDCLVKCLLKLAKTLKVTIKNLDLVQILKGLNEFFVRSPKNIDLPSQPHRMIKTILNEIVRLEGDNILSSLDKAYPSSDNESIPVCSYTNQFLQAHNAQKPSQSTTKVSNDESSKKSSNDEVDTMPVEVKQSLLEIFKNIRSKDPVISKKSIERLYQFKQNNPNIDITPILEKTSSTFQSFIKSSLEKIQLEEEKQEKDDNSKKSSIIIQSKKKDITDENKINYQEDEKEQIETKEKPNTPTNSSLKQPTTILDESSRIISSTNEEEEEESSNPSISSTNNDLAESYMEKLTRIRDKYKSRSNTKPITSSMNTSTYNSRPKPVSINTNTKLTSGNSKLSLNDIKKQLEDVKAMSPQRKKPSKPVYPTSPKSPTPTSSALADLKNQLYTLRNK